MLEKEKIQEEREKIDKDKELIKAINKRIKEQLKVKSEQSKNLETSEQITQIQQVDLPHGIPGSSK